MAVKIGHASIDENGSAIGGEAGDQTGRELCVRAWYTKGWNVLLRPKNAALAERSARACEKACANENIGYDQLARNTLYGAAKAANFDLGAIAAPCECDCSSLMHVCAMAGGANLTYEGNGYTTRTMVAAFFASGDYEKLTDSRYLESDVNLKRGDILVKEGSHTAMVLGEKTPAAVLQLPLLAKGDRSDPVKAMQQLLFTRGYSLPCTGIFEEATADALKAFQKDMALSPDGLCGENTWSALLGLTGVG